MKTEAAVNDFLHSCLARNLSQETINWYQAKLQRFARFCPKLPKDPRPIEAFMAGLKPSQATKQYSLATKQYSLATKQNQFNALRALFRFLSERHEIRNPMAKMRPPGHDSNEEPMATLEADELMMLLYSATTLREKAILSLLVDTGMRSGELAGLRKQDIGAEIVTVRGKSGKRQIPISDDAKRLLLLLMADDSKDDYVFHGHKGRLTRHGVYRIVHAHMKRAGIQGPKLGPHRIRHGFGKGYLVNGGDLRSLQVLMGHKRISTTQKYTSLALKDIIDKHHRFTPLRSAHAAAQQSFPDTGLAIKEAETIIKEAKHRDRL